MNKTSPHPEWATKFRKPGTELRLIRNKYYLYAVSSVYDPITKKGKKRTGKIMGSITQANGFVESAVRVLNKKAQSPIDFSSIAIKEYGFSGFINVYFKEQLDKLKSFFAEDWQQIVAITYCRMVFHSPIKNMPLHLGKSMLTNTLEYSFTDKKISSLLHSIGQKRETVVGFMKSFIDPGDYLLTDLTNIFNASNKISIAKEGYNRHMVFDKQINLLYIYSPTLALPVFYRLFAGNLREVKGIRLTLKESGIQDAIMIADKGFYSAANITFLQEQNLKYIIPLRRDNALIKYELMSKTSSNYFKFDDRYIWYANYELQEQQIFLFLDEKLMIQEEKDFLNRVENKLEGYSIENFLAKNNKFGTMAIITNDLEKNTSRIYSSYKSRNEIEVMFDGMKNVLDADKTYMQNEETLQGWMFINHLALQWYYIIYKMLKEHELLGKYSVNDMIIHLKEVRKVRINGNWVLEPITNQTQKLLSKLQVAIT